VEDIDALTLTTAHSSSSYGVPVLVIEGEVYGPGDMTPAVHVTPVELHGGQQSVLAQRR